MSNNTYSKKYTDDELKAKAIATLNYMNQGEPAAMELIVIVAQRTGMHPNQVVNEIQRLANIPT